MYFVFTRGIPVASRRLSLLLAFSVLSLALSGCGETTTADAPTARSTAAAQSLSDTTCVTFQRGAESAVADAHLSSHQPGHTAGSHPELYVGQVGNHSRHGLLRFDTSSIPSHATITSASLSLWRQGPSSSSSLQAHAVTSPWQESSVSWQGFASAFAPQLAASIPLDGRSGALSVSLTELVATWVRFPSLNHGLLLQQAQGHSLLASSEHSHAARRPALHVCYFLPDSSPDTSSAPSLLLQVMDDAGQPLSGAAVSFGSSSLPTDGAGYAVLDNLSPGFFSAQVRAVGFAPAVVSLHLPAGARASHQVRLQPLGPPQPFTVEEGANLERDTVRVSIPPNAIVDADGLPVTGTVEATLVPLDPTSTPVSALPGPLEGLPSESSAEPVPLESFLMAEVSLWQDGRPLQLAPGASATLELLLPESASAQFSPGDSIPAWWLDTERGLWVREGTGTVLASSTHPSRLSWRVEVHHFTWWNCDAPISDRSCVDVTVTYSNGLPASGVQVGATGVSYTGSSRTAYTDATGHACVEIKRGGTARVFTGLAGQSPVEAMVTGSEQATACGGTSCTPLSLSISPPVCTPGEVQKCAYSGPEGTEDVGLCRSARQYCNATGTAWGPCEGQVLPATETCSNTFDEDCDGQSNEGCGCGAPCYSGPVGTVGVGVCRAGTLQCNMMGLNPYCKGQKLPAPETCATPDVDDDCDGSLGCTNPLTQLLRAGDVSCQSGSQLVRSGNSLFVTGSFSGTMDLGNGVVLNTTSNAAFVAKLDKSTLNPLWAKKFESTSSISLAPPELNANDQLILHGFFNGTLTVEGTTFTGSTGTDLFAMKLDSASGTLLDFHHFITTNGYAHISTLMSNADGSLLAMGNFRGSLTLGGTTVTSINSSELFVAKLDGASSWLYHLDSSDHHVPISSIEWDADGNLLLIGHVHGALTLGGTTITSYPGRYNQFAARLSGTSAWLVALDKASDYAFIHTRTWDAGGDLLLQGSFRGSFTLGDIHLSNSSDQHEYFLAKLGSATGRPLWLIHFDSIEGSNHLSIQERDASGDLLVGGSYSGTLSFGETTLSNPRNSGFVAKFDNASGELLWLSHTEASQHVSVNPPHQLPGDDLITSGAFIGDLTIDSTPYPNPDGRDLFLARLDGTSGAPLWLSQFDGTSYAYFTGSPELTPDGHLCAAGSFVGDLTIGGKTLSSPHGQGLFLGKFDSASGVPLWLSHLNVVEGSASLYQREWDLQGNLLIEGFFFGTLTFGDTTLSNPSFSYSYFLARLDGATGAPVWITQFASTGWISPMSHHETDAQGNLILMGEFAGSLTLGDTTLSAPGGTRSHFLAKLDGTTGAPLWFIQLSNPNGHTQFETRQLDGNGGLVLTGHFFGSLTLGDTTLLSPSNNSFFAIKLDESTGAARWLTHTATTNGYVSVDSAKWDANGHLLLTGYFWGSFTIGGTTFTMSQGNTEHFVVNLDGATGMARGAFHPISVNGSHYIQRRFQDAHDNFLFLLGFQGTLILGEDTLTSDNWQWLLVKAQGATGRLVWMQEFDENQFFWSDIQMDSTGDVFILGSLMGTLHTSHGTPVTSAGCSDVLIGKIPASL